MTARYLLALDLLAPSVPPTRDSMLDIALVRAANLALRRQRDGIEDRVLFMVYGASGRVAVEQALCAYGFPGCEVLFVAEDEELAIDDQGRVTLDEGYGEAIGKDLRRWVEKQHPGSLPLGDFLTTDQVRLAAYREIEWWWIGHESTGTARDWPFGPDQFGDLLPGTHRERGRAWLELLGQGLALEGSDLEGLPYDQFQIQVNAAALIEWLHGFEAASGNGYNQFAPTEVAAALGMDDLFIGYQAAEPLSSSRRTPPEECEDLDEARRNAVLAIAANARPAVRSALAVIGGDGLIFWTLYASIWPRYDCHLCEAMNDMLSLKYADMGDIDQAWQFVHDGWHESADLDFH